MLTYQLASLQQRNARGRESAATSPQRESVSMLARRWLVSLYASNDHTLQIKVKTRRLSL